MRVLLLGTAGYHPTDRRHTACVLLPELGVLFDAGSGMFRVARHLKTDTLDIFLSHTHLDHVVGLTFFFTLLAEHPLRRITVHGEAEKLAALRDHLFALPIFPAFPTFEWCELEETTKLENGATLRSFPLEHPGGSRGYRLEVEEKSLAYVTDVRAKPEADYVEQIRGVDLLLHECNFPAGYDELAERTGHSCLNEVIRVATVAAVKRLALIHFDPLVELPAEQVREVQRLFPEIVFGEDNMELEF